MTIHWTLRNKLLHRCRFCWIITVVTSISVGGVAQSYDRPNVKSQLTLTSNYIEHGISQTENDPAIQAHLVYLLNNQFSLGIFGSSVNYPSNSEHLTLRPSLSFNTNFSNDYSLALEYTIKQYFSSQNRNSNLLSLQFQIPWFYLVIENDSKFEQLSGGVTSWGIRKPYALARDLYLPLNIFYNQVKADGLSSYFDAQFGIQYVADRITLGLLATYNSNSDQFGYRSRPALVFFLTGIF